MPSPRNSPSPARVAAALAAASVLAVPFVIANEGGPEKSYYDSGGVLTGGNGHTGADVPPAGTRITEAQRRAWLRADLGEAGAGIGRCLAGSVVLELPTATLAALEDFALNVGTHAFCKSNLALRFNLRDFRGGCAQMSRWVYDNHRYVPGLANRRVRERALCERDLP